MVGPRGVKTASTASSLIRIDVLRALGETTTAVKVRVVYAVNGDGPKLPQATKAASARSTTLTAIFIASCRRA